MEKEALNYMYNLGKNEDQVVEIGTEKYTKDKLYKVEEPLTSAFKVRNLSSLIEYINSNIDNIQDDIIVHVKSPWEVAVYGALNKDKNRNEYIIAAAQLPDNIYYSHYLNQEQFNIMLQSSFVDTQDKAQLLKFTSLVREDAIKETGDDGVSQSAVIKTGVTTVGEAVVPNPVKLAPYRTFNEVVQPESKFIFRMRKGPEMALYEADGKQWQNEAMDAIRKYLKENINKDKKLPFKITILG